MYLLEVTALGLAMGGVFLAFICLAWLLAEFKGMKDEIRERTGITNEALKLRLQAYERLTLYTERAGLKNLVSRLSLETFGESAAAMHSLLVDTLKSEYEYNISQQIYVSKEVWDAILKLKDQNIYIINQLAATLPHTASAMDLSKTLLEYSMTKNAELNTVI
ncbi:MAG: hypothetical protein EOO13_16210, partial [Chitinophagaceae bacterium]